MATVRERMERLALNKPKPSAPGSLRRAQQRLERTVREARRALAERKPA